MAKIFGINGVMSGKQGAAVYVVRNGVQMVRQYNPYVENPKTVGQVEARAKMKLMSQLSASMAKAIAMPKQGMVSARNQFVKMNYPLTSYAEGEATITLTAVQLTKSVVAMPAIGGGRGENVVNLYVFNAASVGTLDVNRIVYVGFVKQPDNTLRFIGSAVSSTAGADNSWPATIPNVTGELVVYAYGVRDNTELARVTFGNMQTVTAETVAKLIVERVLLESDVTLTETTAVVIPPAQ